MRALRAACAGAFVLTLALEPVTAAEPSLESPGTFPTGLAWDGRYLWNADYNAERIFKIDPSSGAVLRSFPAPEQDPEGLAWDGTSLWHVDGGRAYTLGCEQAKLNVYRIDPGTGKATKAFLAPGPGCNAEDLAWDGSALWYLDGATEARTRGERTVYRLDPESGKVLRRFRAPGDHPSGLAFGDAHLWVSDYSVGKVFRVDPESGEVTKRIDAPKASGLAWSDGHLWIGDFSSDRIYRLNTRGD